MKLGEIPVFYKDLPPQYLKIRTKIAQRNTAARWHIALIVILILLLQHIFFPLWLFSEIPNFGILPRIGEALLAVDLYILPLVGLIFPLSYVKDAMSFAVIDTVVKKKGQRAVSLLKVLEAIEAAGNSKDVRNMKRLSLFIIVIFFISIVIQYSQGARSFEQFSYSMIVFGISGVIMSYYFGYLRTEMIRHSMKDNETKKAKRAFLAKINEASKIVDLPSILFWGIVLVAWLLLYSVVVDIVNEYFPINKQFPWMKDIPTKSTEILKYTSESVFYIFLALGSLVFLAYYLLPQWSFIGRSKVSSLIISVVGGYAIESQFSEPLQQFFPSYLPTQVAAIGAGLLIYVIIEYLSRTIEGINEKKE